MKKIILILFLFLFCKYLFPQENRIGHNTYYEIMELDKHILKNPKDIKSYFYRGLAKLELNDHIAAKEDFKECKKLGLHEKYIEWMTSKSYQVKILSEGYLDPSTISYTNDYKPVYSLKDSLQGALRPERTCYDVYYYNLTVKILPKTKSIEGSNQIYFKTIADTKKIQIDLSDKLKIDSISLNGKELKYTRIFNAIFIDFEEILPANTDHMIMIKYSGTPRVAPYPPWNGGFVWKKTKLFWWIGVACEHLGASSWWPCKDHLSEKPDSMTINIQIPKGYQAISNGNLRSTKVLDKKYRNFEWFVSYPINSYCVTFYMGKFVNFNEPYINNNGSYKIDYYVLPQNFKKAKEYYKMTKDIVKVFEKLFGEYPYKKDGIALVEAPFRGMEHQGAIAIGKEYWNDLKYDCDLLVVHELAHEWWGNTVSMGDMADAWISESFATYAENLFLEEKYGYKDYIHACAENMRDIFNIWPVVGKRDVNDNSFIGNDIYNKGSAMLNNLRCCINDDSLFFSIIKGFYNNYKFKTVTTSDFVNYVNRSSETDYTDFFNKFLYDTIPPILEYNFTLYNDTLLFYYKWTGVGPDFKMPFSITVNNYYNLPLIATTEYQAAQIIGVNTFYLPNENYFRFNQITKNSFTYYWASWKH